MSEVTIKRYDTGLVFTDTLINDGVPVDLTGCTVKFIMKKGMLVFSAAAVIVAPEAGTVSFGPAQLPSEVGSYSQEWEVTFNDQRVLTFPSNTYNTVRVIADLNNAPIPI